jgi:hypothetical protein
MEFYSMETVFAGRPDSFKGLPVADKIIEGILFNCSARIEKDEKENMIPKGNVTEMGLISFL